LGAIRDKPLFIARMIDQYRDMRPMTGGVNDKRAVRPSSQSIKKKR